MLESRQLNQALLEHSTDCIKLLDLEVRLLSMNGLGCKALEIDDFDLVANTYWLDFWKGTFAVAARAAVETAKAGGIGHFQGYCPTWKGTPKWWDVVITPLLDAQGEPEQLLVVSRDITEFKRTEEALRRSEARWNAAIENLEAAVVIATETEQVIYRNPAARAMHGFASDQGGVGPLQDMTRIFQLWTLDGRLLPLDEWPFRRIKRGETLNRLELRLRRLDQGWEKIISYSGAMAESAIGERLMFVSAQDLTDQRKAEHSLRESEERLRLLADHLPDSAVYQYVDEPGVPVRYTYFSAGIERLHTSVLDDLGLVASLKALCREFSEQFPDIAMDFDNGDLPAASISREVSTCLYRVAQESLQNIAKHSRAQMIAIRLGFKKGAVLLTIRDDGAGFDVKTIKRNGGLGLISMKERAHSINGKLTITGRVGHGTQITLEAPLPVQQSIERPRVLLADDHPGALEEIRSVLAPNCEILETVADGRALVEAALRLKPDLIVTDITMPLLNGIEAAVEIKKSLPGMKLLFVTMHASTAYLKAAFEAGGTGYVLKSGLRDELPDAVQSVLGGRNHVSPGLLTEDPEWFQDPTRARSSSSQRARDKSDR